VGQGIDGLKGFGALAPEGITGAERPAGGAARPGGWRRIAIAKGRLCQRSQKKNSTKSS
jgi:hypothetical protein